MGSLRDHTIYGKWLLATDLKALGDYRAILCLKVHEQAT